MKISPFVAKKVYNIYKEQKLMGERLAAEKKKGREPGVVGTVSLSPEAFLRQKTSEVAASLAEDLLPREGDEGLKQSFLSQLSARAEGESETPEDEKVQGLLRERELEALREEIRIRAEGLLRKILG